MTDNIVYEMSLQHQEPHDSVFRERRQHSVFDTNNGTYTNGQIIFDLSNLQGDDMYFDYRNATVQIPICILSACVGATGVQRQPNIGGLSLKNGSHQIISSFSLFIDNVCVENQVQFDNMRISYEMMSKFSYNDYLKWGRTLNFSKDTPASNMFFNAPNQNGLGFSAIMDSPEDLGVDTGFFSSATNQPYNAGFTERQMWMSYSAIGQGSIANNNNFTQVGHNYVDSSSNANFQTYYQLATIRLRDISHFIEAMPLTKRCKMKLILYPNQLTMIQQAQVVSGGNTAGATFQPNPTFSLIGQTTTNPLMLASDSNTTYSEGNSGVINLSTSAGLNMNYEASIGVVTTSLLGTTVTHSIQKCTVWVQGYKLNTEYERKYLEILDGGWKNIIYNRVQNYNYYLIKGGATFTTKLFSGIVNPKKLIVFTLANPTDTSGNIIGCTDLMSPLCPTPGSGSSAFIGGILNYQVTVGGKTLYPEALRYSFQDYLVRSSKTGVNSGVVDGTSSSLWSQIDRDMGTLPYYTSLDRRDNAENETPVNITISGQNNNIITMDLYTFIEYECKARLNVLTGAVELMRH